MLTLGLAEGVPEGWGVRGIDPFRSAAQGPYTFAEEVGDITPGTHLSESLAPGRTDIGPALAKYGPDGVLGARSYYTRGADATLESPYGVTGNRLTDHAMEGLPIGLDEATARSRFGGFPVSEDPAFSNDPMWIFTKEPVLMKYQLPYKK
jgi:hypothetical protein